MKAILKAGAISRNYFNLPLWVAVRRGFFEHEGLEVDLELHEPIDAVTERLRDRRQDLILGVSEHVILDREAGGDMLIVGGNVNRLPFSFITAPDIQRFEDLRGRTIGVSSIDAGSSSLVMRLMADHGLEYPRDYQLRAVGPILARWEMLQNGTIAAGLQGAPLNAIALDQGFHSLCEPREQFPWFQFTSVNVREQWAMAHRDRLVAFLAAYRRAHEWFYANKSGAREIAMQECGIAGHYADRAWEEYTTAEIFPRDAAANPLGVQALIDLSARIRSLPCRRGKAAADYIDHSYLEETSA